MPALRTASLTLCAAALLFDLGCVAVGIYMATHGFTVGVINIVIGVIVVALMGANATLILHVTRRAKRTDIASVRVS